MPDILPDKQYFKIGEASEILEVKPHVLRYWETEFSVLRPQKTRTNQRLYRRQDVELLLEIKRMLYQEGLTIAGAKKRLREIAKNKSPKPASNADTLKVIKDVKRKVQDILALIDEEN